MKARLLYTFTFLLVCSCGAPVADAKKEPGTAEVHVDSVKVAPPKTSSPQNDTAELYTKAIAEYIKAAYTKGTPLPDTLFIGRNIDFPAITLPAVIHTANILLLTSEEAQQKLSYRRSLVFLNVMGWIEKEQAEFLIVRFNEFKPQHNCSIFLVRNAGALVLDSLGFNYQYVKPQKR